MKITVTRNTPGFLLFLWLIAAVPALAAGGMDGRVVDVFNGKVTLQLAAEEAFHAGDRMDITYMAGPVEMLIGRYEVIQAQGSVVFAKEISLSIPPIKDMNVKVTGVQPESGIVIPDSGAMDPVERDPRFLDANTRVKKEEPFPPPVGDEKAAPEKEPVVEVLGPDEGIPEALSVSSGAVKPSSTNVSPASGQTELQDFNAFVKDQKAFPQQELTLMGESPLLDPEAKPGPADSLPTKGKYVLGVEIMNNDSIEGQVRATHPLGVRVISVFPQTAAEKNGIEAGDVISGINNTRVEDTVQFIRVLNASGGEVSLVIQRNGRIITKRVTLQQKNF